MADSVGYEELSFHLKQTLDTGFRLDLAEDMAELFSQWDGGIWNIGNPGAAFHLNKPSCHITVF